MKMSPVSVTPETAHCTVLTDAVVSVNAKKCGRVTVLRFSTIYADAIRITVLDSRKTKAPDGVYRSGSTVAISELGVYLER